jgi:hypothetical protein
MVVLRGLLLLGALFLVGIGVAFAVTGERKYLALGRWVVQGALLLAVCAGLLYVFSRVLLL